MRITFVLPQLTLAGGIRVAAIYANYFHSRGHQVNVVSTPAPEVSLTIRAKNFLRGRTLPSTRIGPSHFDNLPVRKRVLDRYRPVTEHDLPDADVIIATWWETAEWIADLPRAKGRKVHLIQHDETQIPNQPNDRVEATWSLPGFRRIVVAGWLEDMARNHHGVSDVTLINNGVDVTQFNAPPRKKQRSPTIGLMYSGLAFKGCDLALEAFEIATANVPNLKLRCFGAEEPSSTLPLPESAEFHFRPSQDQLSGIYAGCDAWLFASRCEGFGLPILEAMACRTPVIGTPTGAAPELISEGGGVLVKPQDPMEMAIAIERIARLSGPEWLRLSDAAYATAQANTWDASAARFERFLHETIAQPL